MRRGRLKLQCVARERATSCHPHAGKRWRHVYPSGTRGAMKDTGLRIRIERDLREKFLAVCRDQDRPAAQVIREFMKGYISAHGSDAGAASGGLERK